MSLGDIVNNSSRPASVASISAELSSLGVQPGDILLVHSSLSSLGWVNGGAMAVIQALEGSVGPRGTLVMPAQSCDNSNPALWCNPPVPEDWWPDIAATMPTFDPRRTPSSGMGQIAELFRTWPGTRRSPHPQHSFSARGRRAGRITRGHPLDDSLGDPSPLGRLYELQARILMLGTGWESCTALHLAEYRSLWPGKAHTTEWAAVRGRGWTSFRILQTSTDDFRTLGRDFEAVGALRQGKVGLANCRLVDLRTLVDFAAAWFPAHRG